MGHRDLAAAILAVAVRDLQSTHARLRVRAATWLLDDPDSAWWADVAGLNIEDLRRRVRGRLR
jgi:hypothetical protein